MFFNFVAFFAVFALLSIYNFVIYLNVVALRQDNTVLLHKLISLKNDFKDQREEQRTTTTIATMTTITNPSCLPVRCEQETPYRIAFLIPYIESQTDKLLDAMSNWREFLPFDDASDNVRRACDLVFYYHRSKALHEQKFAASRQSILDALRGATNDSRNNFLFENVHFMYADLSDEDDRYPEG